MKFIYREWDAFCAALKQDSLQSVPACEVLQSSAEGKQLILKHDVETNPKKALRMAKIEHQYGHCGSYYVQAYLMTKENQAVFQKIQSMGHEVSYHHDVMDATHGDLTAALAEYEKNIRLFTNYGFSVKTVCQHGNPVVDRIGYTSNRDFFRSEQAQRTYPAQADIMVDFAKKASVDVTYISDAGMGFQVIFDPINNDRIPSNDKNIALPKLEDVRSSILREDGCVIISTHPHRWNANIIASKVRRSIFVTIRAFARFLIKSKAIQTMMGRYYYLAKKL